MRHMEYAVRTELMRDHWGRVSTWRLTLACGCVLTRKARERAGIIDSPPAKPKCEQQQSRGCKNFKASRGVGSTSCDAVDQGGE